MEKRRLSYAFVRILKQGKCSSGCKFCFRIRHSVDLYKYTTGFYGPYRSTYCSFSGENKEKLLKSSNEDFADTSEQQEEGSEKISAFEITHTCTSSQPEVLSGVTKQCSIRDNNDQLKLSYASQNKKNIFKLLGPREGRCVKTLLHKAYMNLKENKLLSEEQSTDITAQTSTQTRKKSSYLQETASIPTHHDRKKSPYLQETASVPTHNDCFDCLDRTLPPQILTQNSRTFGQVSPKNILSDSCSFTAKELFKYNLYLKYQYPNPTQAKILSAMFPNPEKLVYNVMKHVMRADDNYAQRLVVTDHLQRCYWKAHLTLSWPKEVTVLGVHPERDLAIFGSYLHMCERLKEMCLIYENEDGVWVPMTCDRVMMMLEKLSKYGESSLGCSRGRGFKIILEQIKEKDCDRVNISNDLTSSVNKAKVTAEGVEKKSVGSYLQEEVDAKLCQDGSGSVQEDGDMWSPETIVICNNPIDAVSQVAMENMETVSIPNSGIRHISRPRWLCTVHVGWPYPFSVGAEGLSLPAAQIMGHMSVIHKLKLKGLLTGNNSALSRQSIELLMLNTTKQRWKRNMQQLTNKREVETFSADAKIFCDASVTGFGAFLSLAGTHKVSWLSEEWDGHRFEVHVHGNKRVYLHALLGELYAVVTAVFTWKHKLRSQRLLCYSDNLTAVSVINSFASEPVKQATCKDPMDHLIHILQTTCHEYNITLQVSWLGRQENCLADCLSRRDFRTFQAAIPEAAVNKTKAKKLVVKGGSPLYMNMFDESQSFI